LSQARHFSARERSASIDRMKSEDFDVFVVGGGITGAGIAREAALRNYRVALADRGDFAGGTSSKSSKMVHGGLRYLQYYKFRLVFEALRERHTLSKIANFLLEPQPFLITVHSGGKHGLNTYRLGLVLYDLLALLRAPAAHKSLNPTKASELEPLLRCDKLEGGFLYYDYRVDDARLTLANIKTAWSKGAAVANYLQVTGFTKVEGRIAGVLLKDVLSGDEFACRSKVVVNAAGPYVDAVRRLDEPSAPLKLRPTKGVHIVIASERLPISHAVVAEAEDGRNVFAVPWGRYVLIGTTDNDYRGDFDEVYASPGDVTYLLSAINATLSEARLEPRDVIATFAALRPLVVELGVKESEISREHKVFVSRSGLFSIAGGKLTTYRSMAEELMDKVSDVLHYGFGVKAVFLSGSSFDLLDGAFDEKYRKAMVADMVSSGLPGDVAEHLLSSYGSHYKELLDVLRQSPEMARRIKAPLPYIWAEVKYAVEAECAVCLDDVLSRRMHFIFEDPQQGLDEAPQVARYMGKLLDWSPEEEAKQVDRYRHMVDLTRKYREG